MYLKVVFNDEFILEKFTTNPYFILKPSGSSNCFCGAALESSTYLREHFIIRHKKILPTKETTDACYKSDNRCIHCHFYGGTSDVVRRFHLFSAHYEKILPNYSEGRFIRNN